MPTKLPDWVIRDLRHDELMARLRAAESEIPDHSFHPSPTGEYCMACGLSEITPVHAMASPELEVAVEQAYSGMMIALFPDPEQAKRLAVKGGSKASDLHVTLAYFPEAAPEDYDKLGELLQSASKDMPSLSGEISGLGIFSSAHSEGRVTYASVDLPGLPAFRQHLVELCAAHGFELAGNHGYSPHMTLMMGDNRHLDPPNEQLEFDEIVLAAGKRRTAYKLGSPETAAIGDNLPGKHAYSHPHYVHGSGVEDDKTPPCLACGKKPTDPIHHKVSPKAESAQVDAKGAGKLVVGIDAGVDQALVLLRSTPDLPEYAAQARDLLQAIEPACDELIEFFDLKDADDSTVNAEPTVPTAQTEISSVEHVLTQVRPLTERLLVSEIARYYSEDERKDMAAKGEALPDGSFPIADGEDLKNAVALSGHGGDDVKQHIIKRAHALGLEAQLPSSWTSEKAFISEINGRTLLTAPASTFSSLWEQAATPNKHILWMQGRFVGAEKANRNNAFWKTSDLEMGAPTVNHGPLNWLHEARHVIGCIADSKLAVPADYERAAYNAQPYIGAQSAVWRWIYPDEAWVVENASDQGRLYYSMECVSELVECVGDNGCGEKASYSDYMSGKGCLHMRQRSATRRFENPIFLGGAVIVPPVRPGWADAQAQVMRQAASLAEKAYEDAGRPDIPASEWEQMMAGVVLYSQD